MVGLVNLSEGYSADQTVFLWSTNKRTRNVVDEICKFHGFNVFDSTDSASSVTDWLGVPFFVCVVDLAWYTAHQDELGEYSKKGVNDSINIIQIGEDPVRKKDSGRFVPLSDSDFFKALEFSIIDEKKRFDSNLAKKSLI